MEISQDIKKTKKVAGALQMCLSLHEVLFVNKR